MLTPAAWWNVESPPQIVATPRLRDSWPGSWGLELERRFADLVLTSEHHFYAENTFSFSVEVTGGQNQDHRGILGPKMAVSDYDVFSTLYSLQSRHCWSSLRSLWRSVGLRVWSSVVTNIRIRIRIRIFSSESRIFGFGFVIFARRIIFGFVIESWPPNLNLFNIFNLQNLAMKFKLNKIKP